MKFYLLPVAMFVAYLVVALPLSNTLGFWPAILIGLCAEMGVYGTYRLVRDIRKGEKP